MKNEKYIYTGIFFQLEDIKEQLDVRYGYGINSSKRECLEREIRNPHMTLEYKPEEVDPHLFGTKVVAVVVGYGNDGVNEGLLIERISTDCKELKALADGVETPHITLSVSKDGKPVNTRFLKEFKEFKTPFTLKGVYGAFGYDQKLHFDEKFILTAYGSLENGVKEFDSLKSAKKALRKKFKNLDKTFNLYTEEDILWGAWDEESNMEIENPNIEIDDTKIFFEDTVDEKFIRQIYEIEKKPENKTEELEYEMKRINRIQKFRGNNKEMQKELLRMQIILAELLKEEKALNETKKEIPWGLVDADIKGVDYFPEEFGWAFAAYNNFFD